MGTLSDFFTYHTEHVYKECIMGNTCVPSVEAVTQLE